MRCPRRNGCGLWGGGERRRRAGRSLCSVGGRAPRPRASLCSVGGTPRPEVPTMTPISVRLGVSGDGEDDASMPGHPTGGLAKPEAVAYAIDPAAHPSLMPSIRPPTCRRCHRPGRPPVADAIDPGRPPVSYAVDPNRRCRWRSRQTAEPVAGIADRLLPRGETPLDPARPTWLGRGRPEAECLLEEVDLERQDVLGHDLLRGHVGDAGERQHRVRVPGREQGRGQP
jgi:hypothetical protein